MHLNDESLILHYYGELPPAEESAVEGHLAACAACRTSYGRLQRVLAVVDTAPVPELPPGYEQDVWARLQQRLPAGRRAWWSSIGLGSVRWALAAGVVILVVGAFVAGRFSSAPSPRSTATADDSRERILLVAVGDHLEQSQMALIELVNADGPDSVDVSAARDQAAELVTANRLYRQTAEGLDPRLAGVLDELEPTLVELARSPARLSRSEWDTIVKSIEAQGLLFKLRVVSQEVHEREKTAAAPSSHGVS
jgi:predicted anti-sigma-YlaC factor YlaD